MGEHQLKWFASMRKKLGVKTDEEVREYMRKQGMKGEKTGTGGFKYLQENDPDKLKAISREGGKKRHGLE